MRLGVLILVLASCRGARSPVEASSTPTPSPVAPTAAAREAADDLLLSEKTTSPNAASTPPSDGRPVLLVTEPSVLAELERSGFSLGRLAFGQGNSSIASFRDAPRFRDLRTWLGRDLDDLAASDPKAGVGMKHRHRLFDRAWLDTHAQKTRFELIAVVNRTDRQPFEPNHCGEVRFVYRLAYQTQLEGTPIDSRLPMTVNVVFWQKNRDGCPTVARSWLAPSTDANPHAGSAFARWLTRVEHGPLAPSNLDGALKSIEIDVQAVRWPSTVHPSLGGHAAYVLRVFQPNGEGLAPAPLENTPDPTRLASPEGRHALLAWLRDPTTLAALDEGVAVLPTELAATRALSFTPLGLARAANRPFSAALRSRDLRDLDLANRTHIGSPEALLRRLDSLTCQGCHAIRSIAGFHLVGEAKSRETTLDTLFFASSAHLQGDLERRASWLRAMAEGTISPTKRPLPDVDLDASGGITPGRYGDHCGLTIEGEEGSRSPFSAWTCASGLRCVPFDDRFVGTCLPEGPRLAGDPCQSGSLRTSARAERDVVTSQQTLDCGPEAACNTTAVGFPGGMCTRACETLRPGEACGAIVNLATFNTCVGRRQPFPSCIERAAFPAGMRGCDADHRCRDDYICARSPQSPLVGVCLPPYFLFQLRVDGHVL